MKQVLSLRRGHPTSASPRIRRYVHLSDRPAPTGRAPIEGARLAGPSLYEQVAAPAMLQRAWEHVRQGGRAPGVDGVTLGTFAARASEMLAALRGELLDGSYGPRPPRYFVLQLPARRPRRIAVLSLRDRIVQRAMLEVLEPVLDPVIGPAAYGGRRGRGVTDAITALHAHAVRGLEWVARADIAHCFDSIRHDRLLVAIERVVVDERMRWLVREQLRALTENSTPLGLPQGAPLSALLANVYLAPLDRRFGAAGTAVIRFIDDIAASGRDRSTAQSALDQATRTARGLGLRFAPEKTYVVRYWSGFRFLGKTLPLGSTGSDTAGPAEIHDAGGECSAFDAAQSGDSP